MIKDISNANENVTANSYEIQKLKQALPQCFTSDGSFNMEAFKNILDGNVNITNEGYELKFLGKSYARLLAALDTETIIVPNEEHNNKPENANSENIYITGDNLDALKHLLKSYEGKIKCIYIDPPYNTGSDGFVYNDKFAFTKDELVRKLSIDEEQAERILDLTNRGSASHSAWLTFMFPRLLLARDLLSKDGVIFISIDDNEVANCKLIGDYLFGEENSIGMIANINNPKGRSDDNYFATSHEYILVYKRSETILAEFEVEDKVLRRYREEDAEGNKYRLIDLRKTGDSDLRSDREDMFYPFYYNESSDDLIVGELGGVVPLGYVEILPMKTEVVEGRWRWGKEDKAMKEGFKNLVALYMPKKKQWSVFEKDYLNSKTGVKPTTVWDFKDVNSERGTEVFVSLGFDKEVFLKPKPVGTISRCLTISVGNDDIVLDFFSGSGTTAHAVMEYNIDKERNNKYIMVQLPEPTKANSTARNAGYETIDQIGRERIIRAAAKIKEANPETTADLGFKHYVLQDVPEKKLIELEDFDPDAMFAEEKLLEYFTKPTILTTWLVKDGYGFNAKVEEIKLADYTAYYCDNYLYFLDTDFDDEAMKALYEKYDAEISFKPENVVLFGYSFTYTQTALLKDNLKKLKAVEDNKNVNVIVRY